MLIRQEIKKYVSIFLVLLLVIQLVHITYINVEWLRSNEEKSVLVFPKIAVETDITLLNRDGRKTSFHSVSTESYAGLAERYSFGFSETKSFYSLKVDDYREKIKQTIPHYFHGSKYKNNYYCC